METAITHSKLNVDESDDGDDGYDDDGDGDDGQSGNKSCGTPRIHPGPRLQVESNNMIRAMNDVCTSFGLEGQSFVIRT